MCTFVPKKKITSSQLRSESVVGTRGNNHSQATVFAHEVLQLRRHFSQLATIFHVFQYGKGELESVEQDSSTEQQNFYAGATISFTALRETPHSPTFPVSVLHSGTQTGSLWLKFVLCCLPAAGKTRCLARILLAHLPSLCPFVLRRHGKKEIPSATCRGHIETSSLVCVCGKL